MFVNNAGQIVPEGNIPRMFATDNSRGKMLAHTSCREGRRGSDCASVALFLQTTLCKFAVVCEMKKSRFSISIQPIKHVFNILSLINPFISPNSIGGIHGNLYH
jgi:hypothetical protein